MEAGRTDEHVRVKRDYQKDTISNFDDSGQFKVNFLLNEINCLTILIDLGILRTVLFTHAEMEIATGHIQAKRVASTAH